MNIVDKELSLAGTDNPITPELLELDRFRIMSDTPVPAEEYLLRMFGKPCCTNFHCGEKAKALRLQPITI